MVYNYLNTTVVVVIMIIVLSSLTNILLFFFFYLFIFILIYNRTSGPRTNSVNSTKINNKTTNALGLGNEKGKN